MVKAKLSDVKKQLEKQKDLYGDHDSSEKVANVEDLYEKAVGHKPKQGANLADEIEEAERVRRGKLPHKIKKEE